MKLTEAFKAWLVENCGVKADATDDEFRKAAGIALAEGTLTAETMLKLSADPETKTASVFEQKLDAMLDGINKLASVMSTPAAPAAEPSKTVEEPVREKAVEEPQEKHPTTWYDQVQGTFRTASDPAEKEVGADIRVKRAHESYSTTKSMAIFPDRTKNGKPHPLAGRPMKWFADQAGAIDTPSDLDKAVAGVFGKFMCQVARRGNSKTLGYHALNDHEKDLLHYAMDKMSWGGSSDGGDYADIKNRTLNGMEQKALIDDATSGGLEAAPIVFDDMIIYAPLLNGELFPLVNVVPLERGRRVEGVATGTPTGSWGGIDASAISLFTTTSYVSAFDTTVYRWEGAIQIGLDFLSDTPIDFGTHLANQYGERLLEDLDDVIAVGNGTTQPEGVINKSGATSVNFGGTTTLGNYESLRFGVAKAEHKANLVNTAVFCGTETSYMRARALPVGASDARRLGGMDYSSYRWMERDYKINESLTNAQIFYAILGRYRMYQRRGMTMRSSTEGDTLIRANSLLMCCTARYGGQLERGACAAITTTAPA